MTGLRSKSIWTLALLGSGLLGCARQHEGDAGDADSTSEAVVQVHVAAVEIRPFESTVAAPGQWRSSGELVISCPFAGVLESLTARVGDHVHRGQKVGEVITRESLAALRGAELMMSEAHDASTQAEARRALALAKRDVVRVPLTAAQPGVVVRRSLEPGAQVSEAAEVLALVPEGNFVFEAHIPAASSHSVRVGQHANVIELNQTAHPAIVQRILPTSDEADQSVLAWLSPLGNASPVIGQYGSASIAIGPPHVAPAVPDSAVVEDDLTGVRRVAVVGSDRRMTWVPVLLGTADLGWHELVRSRLAAGTRIILSGQRGLPDSTRVTWGP